MPCGTVEASLRIDRGIITALTFSGDFLFDEPSEDLAKKLIGLRYDKATLSAAIEKAGAGKYFRSANASQICSLLLGE